MSDVSTSRPKGVLRRGWSASVGDYAIAGGWSLHGEALVVGDAAGGVYAFDGKSGASAWARQEAHDGGVLAMAIHPSGTGFATAGQDGRVLVWGVAEGQVEQAIDVGSDWVENVAWSPDGQWLAASCSRQVRAYGADGGEVWRSDDHPSTVSAVAWSSAGELATACYGRVTFFDASTGERRQKLEWKGSLVSMVLSPDGEIVACGSQDNSVHFWRRSTEQDAMMSGYPGKPSALAFDDAGTLLATGGGDDVTVWSFEGGGPEGTRPGILARGPEFWSIMFNRSQRLPSLAAGCAWPRQHGTAPSSCGRLGGMETAVQSGPRLWRVSVRSCTGARTGARLPRSTPGAA